MNIQYTLGKIFPNQENNKEIVLLFLFVILLLILGSLIGYGYYWILFLLLGVIFVGFIVKDPFTGLCLTIGSVPLITLFPEVLLFTSMTASIGALTFGSYIIAILQGKEKFKYLRNSSYYWVFGFVVSLIISILFGQAYQLSKLFTFFQLIALLIVVHQLANSKKKIEWIMLVWIGSMALGQIYGLMNFDLGKIGRSNRFLTFVQDPNLLSYYSLISSWFIYYFLKKKPGVWLKILLSVIYGLSILVILFTSSRSGWLITLFSFLIAIYIFRSKFFRGFGFVFILILVSIVFLQISIDFQSLFISTMRGIPERIYETILYPDMIMDDEISRILILRSGVQTWKNYPVFGVGTGGGRIINAYQYRLSDIPWRSSHNAYLSILVENGLLGLFFFLGIFVSTWKNFNICVSEKEGFVSLANIWKVVYATTALFAFTLGLEYNKFLWVIFGVSIALYEATE